MLSSSCSLRLASQLEALQEIAAGAGAGSSPARTGVHPTLGELPIPLWIEFFLLHEAHHLYVVMTLARRPGRV